MALSPEELKLLSGTNDEVQPPDPVQRQKDIVDLNLNQATKIDPDKAGRVRQVAAETQLPEDVVDRNLPELERQQKINQSRPDPAVNPRTAKFLEQFKNAEVAHDDVDTLKQFEKSDKTHSDFSNAFRLFAQNSNDMVGNISKMVGGLISDNAMELMAYASLVSPGLANLVGEGEDLGGAIATASETTTGLGQRLARQGQSWGYEPRYTAERLINDPTIMNFLGASYEQGVGSLPYMVEAGISPTALAMTIGQGIAEDRAANDNRTFVSEQDRQIGLMNALAVSLIERVFLGKLFEKIPAGGKDLVTRTDVAKFAAAETAKKVADESLSEVVQEVWEYAAGSLGTEKGMTMRDTLVAAVGGFVGSVGVTTTIAAPTAVAEGVKRKQADNIVRTANTITDQQYIDEAITFAQNNKLNTRDPAALKEFLKEFGDDRLIRVDVEVMDAMRREGFDVPILTPEQRVAGEYTMPLQDFATSMALDEKTLERIRPHVRVDENAMTRAELETRDTVGDIRKMMNKAIKDKTIRDEMTAFEDNLTEQLVATGRLNERDARMSAALVSARFARYAQALRDQGKEATFQDIVDRFGMRVEGPMTPAPAADDKTILDQARKSGYQGEDVTEASEWQRAVDKGLDMSEEARLQRAREMGYDTEQPVYHGTTHDIKEFDGSLANPENHFGRGVYMTTSPDDAGTNYLADGSDLTQRIELNAERLVDWLSDMTADELATELGISVDDAQSIIDSGDYYDAAVSKSRKELTGESQGHLMPLYVNKENLVVIKGRDSTLIESDVNLDDFIEEAKAEGLTDEDEIYDRAHELQDMAGGTLYEKINEALRQTDIYQDDMAISNIIDEIMSDLGEGSILASDLDSAIRNNVYEAYDDNGEMLSAGEISRQVFENLGYDGVVMDADAAFGSGRRLGRQMEGVTPGTEHYIIFPGKEHLIRSVNAAFDPDYADSPNILAQDDKTLGLKSDIPSDRWVAEKQRYAEEDMQRYKDRKNLTSRGLQGAVTGYFRDSEGNTRFFMLPTAELIKLEGVQGEEEWRDSDERFESIKASIEQNGYDQSEPIFVNVNHLGQAFVNEGNHRLAAAHAAGVTHIPVEIRYYNGGELADGPLAPEKLSGMMAPDRQGIQEQIRINLSAAVSDPKKNMLGLTALYDAANQGDKQAVSLLHMITHDAVVNLTSGIDSAVISYDNTVGLFAGTVEPSVAVTLSFDPKDREQVLAVIGRFGRNFKQDEIHMLEDTTTDETNPQEYDDGSYDTPVVAIELNRPLTRQEIDQVIGYSGLYGMNTTDDRLEFYHVGELTDESIAEFKQKAARAREAVSAIKTADGGSAYRGQRTRTQKLTIFGEGEGTIEYPSGDLQTAPTSSASTALHRLTEVYAGREVKPAQQGVADENAQFRLQRGIMRAYEDMPVNDLANDLVRRAYEALAQETIEQYRAMPIKVIVKGWDEELEFEGRKYGKGEPYGDSNQMRRDILDNNNLVILKTDDKAFGPEGVTYDNHPLLRETDIVDQNGNPMLVNDLFRAIHDYYAHTLSPTQFGPKGEEAGWKNHMAMTKSPWARWALTTETRGQNSWVNFRPEVQGKPLAERGFAIQKVGLLPIKYALTGDAFTDAPMMDLAEEYSDWNISNRVPTITPKNPLREDYIQEMLELELDKVAAPQLKKWADLIKEYPVYKPTRKNENPQKTIDRFLEEIEANILWMFDNIEPEVRERSKLWYDGANRMAESFGQRHGVSTRAAAGVIAALSPGMDWFQNMSMAERLIDIYTTKLDFEPDQAMADFAKSLDDRKAYENKPDGWVQSVAAQKLRDLQTPEERALWIRVYDESHNLQQYRSITPEGNFGDWVRKKNGSPAKFGWATLGPMAKAIDILDTPTLSNISEKIGKDHKVRNFYNNIIDPMSERPWVTIDTHAVGVAHISPFSQKAVPVIHNFSGPSSQITGQNGLYTLYAEAYKRAAEKRNILPREMQSITWEAQRVLFAPSWKTKANTTMIDNLWKEYHKGVRTLEETKAAIVEAANGFGKPVWVDMPVDQSPDIAYSSFKDDMTAGSDGEFISPFRQDLEGATFYQSAERNNIGMYSQVEQVILDMTIPAWKTTKGKGLTVDEKARLDELTDKADQFESSSDPEYKELQKLRKKQQDNMPQARGRDILAKLLATPGIKKQEVEFLGITEFLDTDETFSREQVAAYVRNNGPVFDEVVDSSTSNIEFEWDEYEVPYEESIRFNDSSDQQDREDYEDNPDFLLIDANSGIRIYRNTEDEEYTITGVNGEISVANSFDEAEDIIRRQDGGVTEGDARYAQYNTPGQWDEYHEYRVNMPDVNGDFRAAYHFPDSNTMFFSRVTYRGSDFHLDETQSDWVSTQRKIRNKAVKDVVSKLVEAAVLNGDNKQLLKDMQDYDRKTPKSDLFWELKKQASDMVPKDWGWVDFDYQQFKDKVDDIVNKEKAEIDRRFKEAGVPMSMDSQYPDSIPPREVTFERRSIVTDIRAESNNLRDIYMLLGNIPREAPQQPPYTDDTWLTLSLKRNLIMAAEDGFETFSWPQGSVLKDRYSDNYEYGPQYDRKMVSIIKKLTGQNPESTTNDEGVPIWQVSLTPELKRKIEEEAFSMFQDPTVRRGSITLPSPGNPDYIIRLTEASDRSTFLHEAAHMFLEMEREFVREFGLTEDQQTILDWLGVASFDVLTREDHEKFAETFEVYLMEGKAPSIKLREAFRNFRRWLTRIYTEVRRMVNLSNADLNPEISEVFDRMLATDEEIEMAAMDPQFEEMFDEKHPGMTDEEWQKYEKQKEKRKDKAKETLFEKVVKQLTRQYTSDWKSEMEPLVDEEIDRLSKLPVYAVMKDLAEYPMDNKALKEIIGYDKIPGRLIGRVRNEEGVDPQEYAEVYGYSTVQEMYDDIVNSKPLKEAAREAAQARMVEKYGDILNDGTIEQEAREALHNEDQAELVLAEMKALDGKRADMFNREVLKQNARDTIARLTYKQIQPNQFYQAEIRAARKAAQAKTDEERFKYKTQQLINHYLYREAMDTKSRMEKNRKYVRGVQTREYSTRQVDPVYVANLKAVANMYDMRTNPQKILTIKNVLEWYKGQMGPDTLVDVTLLDHNLIRALEADEDGRLEQLTLPSFEDLTADELQALTDQLKHFRYLGGLLSEDSKQEVRLKAEALAESIKTNGGKDRPQTLGVQVRGREVGEMVNDLVNRLPSLRNLLRKLDNAFKNRDDGLAFDFIYRPIEDAMNKKMDISGKIYREFKEQMNGVHKVSMSRKIDKTYVLADGRSIIMNEEGRFMMALYWGTETSRVSLMEGLGATEADIMMILKDMNPDQLELVNKVWEMNESMWPELQKASIARHGVAPPKLDATPFEINGVKMTGGHMRLFYDANDIEKKIEQKDAEMMQSIMPTKAGSLHARVGGGGRSVSLNIGNVSRAMAENIHYIAFAEMSVDISTILHNKSVKAAIELKHGRGFWNALTDNVKNITANRNEREAVRGLAWISKIARHAATMKHLAYSIRNTVQQFGAAKIAFDEVGTLEFTDAFSRTFLGSDADATREFINQRSKFMENRASVVNREAAEHLRNIQVTGKAQYAWKVFVEQGFTPQTIVDSLFAYPVWLSTYEKRLAVHGDDKRAVSEADTAVSESVGSGSDLHLGQLYQQGNTEFVKLMTTFGSWFNAYYNRVYRETGGFDPADFDYKAFRAVVTTPFITAVLSSLIVMDTPEDDDEWLSWALGSYTSFMAGMLPLVRDIAGTFRGYTPKTAVSGFLEAPSVVVKELADVLEGDQSAGQAVIDISKRGVTSVVPIPGSGQVLRMWDFYESNREGNETGSPLKKTYQAMVKGPER